MRHLCLSLFALALLALPATAQSRDETLADIRQELSVLYVEVQRLKRELSTTGGVSQPAVGGSVLDRVAAIEAELQRLTSKTEELEFRIDSVVRDGTNRIGDLEFRLCELEEGCDIAALGEGTTLGGVEPSTGAAMSEPATDNPATPQAELAIGEQADFDTATQALEAGEFQAAADQFGLFLQNYPGSPLSGQAALQRGAALEGAGQETQAARAYLDLFSKDPNGADAPEALFRLGRALGRLGQVNEACVTLGEVGLRFPGGAAEEQARAEMQALSCP
jgi:tol-pal system protein YbgF